jgi:hypothetical protein
VRHASSRTANLLGACALAVADDLQAAASGALGGAGPSLAAGVVTLANLGGAARSTGS